jgi:tetratricopeptide (TPR) repeat protein
MSSSMIETVKIFYCYAPEDRALLDQLDKQLSPLKRLREITSWSDCDIHAGKEWAQEIQTHLAEASIVLVLVSPDFIASDYCYDEQMQVAFKKHLAGKACIIPIVVRPVTWEDTVLGNLQALPTNRKPVTSWANRDEAFWDVAKGVRQVVKRLLPTKVENPTDIDTWKKPLQEAIVEVGAEPDEPLLHQAQQLLVEVLPTSPLSPAPGQVPGVWNIPFARNPFFTGQEGLLFELHAQLQQHNNVTIGQAQALSGLGGIGKTQLAVEYAYRHRSDYYEMLWAHADTVETLTSSYNEIAALLQLPEKNAQQQDVVIQAVKFWLRSHREYLFILDNADTPEILRPFLPSDLTGHLLITTRATDLSNLGLGLSDSLAVQVLPLEQAVHLLLHRAGILLSATPQEHTLAEYFATELGGLPLALDQVGAYLAATKTSLSSYHQLYQHHRAHLLSEHSNKVEHPQPVATTWDLSFQRVTQQNPAAADLLRFCAFLAPDALPEIILTEGATELGPVLAPVAGNLLQLDNAIAALLAYSLIDRDPRTKTLAVHRLVQTVLRDALLEPEQRMWEERAIHALARVFPWPEVATWDLCQRLLPHAEFCAKWITPRGMKDLESAYLLSSVGEYLFNRAEYREAQTYDEQALRIYQAVLGEQHPSTAASLNNLGLVYRARGNYPKAEAVLLQASTMYHEALGEQHPDTAASLNNLGLVYRAQGNYREAEKAHLQALAIYSTMPREHILDIATSLDNLGLVYRNQGNYPEAEDAHLQAGAIYYTELGERHPNTATTLNNLGLVYTAQGKYALAEQANLQALVIRRAALGELHADTAHSLEGLGNAYSAQKKYLQAETAHMQALVIRRTIVGEQHVDTANSLNDLAGVYRAQGKYPEAEALYDQAQGIYKALLGEEHPEIARCLYNLALLHQAQKNYKAALPLFKQALTMRQKMLSPEHPHTQEAQRSYEQTLRAMETGAVEELFGSAEV